MRDVINLKYDVITRYTFNRSLLLEDQNFEIRSVLAPEILINIKLSLRCYINWEVIPEKTRKNLKKTRKNPKKNEKNRKTNLLSVPVITGRSQIREIENKIRQ